MDDVTTEKYAERIASALEGIEAALTTLAGLQLSRRHSAGAKRTLEVADSIIRERRGA